MAADSWIYRTEIFKAELKLWSHKQHEYDMQWGKMINKLDVISLLQSQLAPTCGKCWGESRQEDGRVWAWPPANWGF